MKPEVKEALKQSIKHWEKNTQFYKIDDLALGRQDCALCGLFNSDTTFHIYRCVGCPISEVTGQNYCRGTPYVHVERLYQDSCENCAENEDYEASYEEEQEIREAAKEMLEFLVGLLDEDTKKGE